MDPVPCSVESDSPHHPHPPIVSKKSKVLRPDSYGNLRFRAYLGWEPRRDTLGAKIPDRCCVRSSAMLFGRDAQLIPMIGQTSTEFGVNEVRLPFLSYQHPRRATKAPSNSSLTRFGYLNEETKDRECFDINLDSSLVDPSVAAIVFVVMPGLIDGHKRCVDEIKYRLVQLDSENDDEEVKIFSPKKVKPQTEWGPGQSELNTELNQSAVAFVIARLGNSESASEWTATPLGKTAVSRRPPPGMKPGSRRQPYLQTDYLSLRVKCMELLPYYCLDSGIPFAHKGFLRAQLKSLPKKIVVPVTGFTFVCRAENLDKMDLFGLSDPYFTLTVGMTEEEPAYKSEIIKKTLNPTWKEGFVPDSKIPGLFEADGPLQCRIEVTDWDRMSSDDFIGSHTFDLRELMRDGRMEFDLVNPDKRGAMKTSGRFCFESFQAGTREMKIYNPDRKPILDELMQIV